MKKNFNKTWKKFLSEGTLRYDEQTVGYLADVITKYDSMDQDELNKILKKSSYDQTYYNEKIEIPYSRILEERDTDRTTLVNGLILFHYFHVSGMDQQKASEMLQRNFSGREFAYDFEQQFVNEASYKFDFFIMNPEPDEDDTAYLAIDDGNFSIVYYIYSGEYLGYQSIMKHEVRHLYQGIFSMALEYGNLINTHGGQFNKIKKISEDDMLNMKIKYGVGKKTKKVKYEDEFLKYLSKPTEFEPHIGDVADMFVKFLLRNYINKEELAVARMKQDNDNIFQLRSFLGSRVDDQQLYSKLVSSYLRDPGISDLTSYWLSQLINDEEFKKHFIFNALDVKKYDYLDASYFEEMQEYLAVFSKRLKEFSDKLKIEIEKYLYDEAEPTQDFIRRIQK